MSKSGDISGDGSGVAGVGLTAADLAERNSSLAEVFGHTSDGSFVPRGDGGYDFYGAGWWVWHFFSGPDLALRSFGCVTPAYGLAIDLGYLGAEGLRGGSSDGPSEPFLVFLDWLDERGAFDRPPAEGFCEGEADDGARS